MNALFTAFHTIDAEDQEEVIRHHLTAAHKRLPNDPEVIHMLSVFYKTTGQQDQAIAMLGSLETSDLSATNLAKLAMVNRQWGRTAEAERCATESAERFAVDGKQLQSADDFIWWAKALALNANHSKALNALVQGHKRFPTELADAVRTQSRIVLRSSSNIGEWRQVATQLLRAIDDVAVQTEIAAAAIEPKTVDVVMSTFEPFMDELAPEALAVLADALLANKRYHKAATLYARAIELDDTNSKVANNYAWLLTQSSPPICAKPWRLPTRRSQHNRTTPNIWKHEAKSISSSNDGRLLRET